MARPAADRKLEYADALSMVVDILLEHHPQGLMITSLADRLTEECEKIGKASIAKKTLKALLEADVRFACVGVSRISQVWTLSGVHIVRFQLDRNDMDLVATAISHRDQMQRPVPVNRSNPAGAVLAQICREWLHQQNHASQPMSLPKSVKVANNLSRDYRTRST